MAITPPVIAKSLKAAFPGFGIATTYGCAVNVNTNTSANTTITLNTNANAVSNTYTPLSQPLSNGRIRVRSNVVGNAATCKVVNITATDGTNTVQIYAGDAAAAAANVALDEVIDFVTNLTLNSFSVVINVGTNNSTHDVEIAGNL